MSHLKPVSKTEYRYRSGDSGPAVQVSVYYSAGFMLIERGIWLLVQSVAANTDGYAFPLNDGIRVLLAPAERLKASLLRSMAERIDRLVSELRTVCDSQGDRAAVEAHVKEALGMGVVRG